VSHVTAHLRWLHHGWASHPIGGCQTEEPDNMANIDHKQGTYTIPANASQQYTFWWGRDSKAPNEFFDVSIAPHHDKDRRTMEPLRQTDRSVVWDLRGGVGVVLFITLQNPNSFAVTFEANHVRIY
jgi:hypothetical protein